uniref:Ig-like domain-containing protein n=1 Tax=Callorhinchus milii TaxID=7868 RepID=A0A4W3GFY1_CALMI
VLSLSRRVQQRAGLSKQEGYTVILSCSYINSSNYVALYWYRHHPGLAPQYILYRHSNGIENTADYAKGRFASYLGKDQLQSTLIIPSVIVNDAATYYCALTSDALCCKAMTSLYTNPTNVEAQCYAKQLCFYCETCKLKLLTKKVSFHSSDETFRHTPLFDLQFVGTRLVVDRRIAFLGVMIPIKNMNSKLFTQSWTVRGTTMSAINCRDSPTKYTVTRFCSVSCEAI